VALTETVRVAGSCLLAAVTLTHDAVGVTRLNVIPAGLLRTATVCGGSDVAPSTARRLSADGDATILAVVATRMVYVAVAGMAVASRAETLNVQDPAEEGVPDIRPLAIARPGGSVPEPIVQATFPKPPVVVMD
jgi:hypothetical protein